MSATEEMDQIDRAVLGLTWIAGMLGNALNGRYRSTFTGSIVTVSDGEDVLHKTVTTAYGEARVESIRDVCKAINIGWYSRLVDE